MRIVAELVLLTGAGGLAACAMWMALKSHVAAAKAARDLADAKTREAIAIEYERAAQEAWREAYQMATAADLARAEAARLIAGPLGMRARSKDAPS
jgi:hypothetical protein